jgi:hypothetical protein
MLSFFARENMQENNQKLALMSRDELKSLFNDTGSAFMKTNKANSLICTKCNIDHPNWKVKGGGGDVNCISYQARCGHLDCNGTPSLDSICHYRINNPGNSSEEFLERCKEYISQKVLLGNYWKKAPVMNKAAETTKNSSKRSTTTGQSVSPTAIRIKLNDATDASQASGSNSSFKKIKITNNCDTVTPINSNKATAAQSEWSTALLENENSLEDKFEQLSDEGSDLSDCENMISSSEDGTDNEAGFTSAMKERGYKNKKMVAEHNTIAKLMRSKNIDDINEGTERNKKLQALLKRNLNKKSAAIAKAIQEERNKPVINNKITNQTISSFNSEQAMAQMAQVVKELQSTIELLQNELAEEKKQRKISEENLKKINEQNQKNYETLLNAINENKYVPGANFKNNSEPKNLNINKKNNAQKNYVVPETRTTADAIAPSSSNNTNHNLIHTEYEQTFEEIFPEHQNPEIPENQTYSTVAKKSTIKNFKRIQKAAASLAHTVPGIPMKFEKKQFKIASYKLRNKSPYEKQMIVREYLKKIGLLTYLKLFSRIGNSIVEIYYPEINGLVVDSILAQEKLSEVFGFKPYDVPAFLDQNKDNSSQTTTRLAFLMSIAPFVEVKRTILKDVHEDRKKEILLKLREREINYYIDTRVWGEYLAGNPPSVAQRMVTDENNVVVNLNESVAARDSSQ